MPPVVLDIFLLAAGIALLWFGGNMLVGGSVTIAFRLGISPLVVGLTVVAFGTSAPELAFNVIASASDKDSLVFGNIVGSNICNIGLILGLAALFKPLIVHSDLVRREIPVMIAATLLMALLAHFGPAVDEAGSAGYSRIEGAILLGLMLLHLLATLWFALRTRPEMDDLSQEVRDANREDMARPLGKAVLLTLGGLALLVGGGQLGSLGAVGVARALRIPEEVIGLTIVAVGTSLPELAASIIATRRGQIDVAVGNIVGSNIFNILFIFGLSSAIAPVTLPERAWASLGVMCLFALMLLVMSRSRGSRLSRAEGIILLAAYAGYLAYQCWLALASRSSHSAALVGL